MNKPAAFREQFFSFWNRLTHFPAGTLTATAIQHPKRIKFSGTPNFRDLGAYPTIDGRVIKKGMLYRSGHLSGLNSLDLQLFASLGLNSIYDLRNEDECKVNPDRLPAHHSIRLIDLPFAYKVLDFATMQKRVLRGELHKGEAEAVMLDAYRTYVIDYREQLAMLFRSLLETGAYPALIHCIHGKDRTGLAISLILEALGVPRDIIRQDYMLSNHYCKFETLKIALMASILSRFRASRDEVRCLMEARTEYLDAAFQAMEKQFACIDNYFQEGLGLDENKRERLQKILLE